MHTGYFSVDLTLFSAVQCMCQPVPFLHDKIYSEKDKGKGGNDIITQNTFDKKGKMTKCWGMMELDHLNGAGLWSRHGHIAASQGSYALALMMSINSGLREAPPTRKPSTSFWEASSLQVPPVTEPEEESVELVRRGGSGKSKWEHGCFNLVTMTDLHRWSSQSWLQPQIRWSSATPSVSHEPPEPDRSHRKQTHYEGLW